MHIAIIMKAIGLRIKSGFAIAAIVSKSGAGCAIEAVRTVALSTEELPQTRFPYHPTIELPERQGAALSDKAVKEVRRTAASEMGKLLQEHDFAARSAAGERLAPRRRVFAPSAVADVRWRGSGHATPVWLSRL